VGSLRVFDISISREGTKWRAFLTMISENLAMCESEAEVATCFARFRARKSF
jgi:hypothetical protein